MGGRLVCEFAYIRQEENESYEVNSFPFGQTHVGFTNLCLRGIAATAERSSSGNCIRVASIKILGWQYYSLTAPIPVDESPGIQKVYNHASRGCQKLLQTKKTRCVSLRTGQGNERSKRLTTSTNKPMR